ncbi:AraC-like ligand binding domain-containing protein [Cohnella sp. OV330]|uniref:AraC family transcriptional regulator n=1 Tax=Cohnella sp. OV330 TaxID=1855288 RepID=UPI0008F3C47A|nr:AraC family transcriptional regulator [Cohnella sp. OV330]SFB09148.1 AraC-like ligand binding domain-containing protein [Cohnella sp. OV330]
MIKRRIEVTPSHIFFDGELPFYINRVSESYELGYHAHEFTEISYVGEGEGHQYIGEERLRVRRGDLFTLPLGASHVFRPSSANAGRPLVVYNFLFEAERMSEALRGFPGLDRLGRALACLDLAPGDGGWRKMQDRTGAFEAFFAAAYPEFVGRRTGYQTRIYALFIVLLTEIERRLADEPHGARAGHAGGLEDALSFIRASLASPITASQAAEAGGMSERHFYRLFAKATGLTFGQYVQRLRIERSCELLRRTRLSVQEVAEAVGYQDRGHFLDVFKKITGLAPRSYRSSYEKLPDEGERGQ